MQTQVCGAASLLETLRASAAQGSHGSDLRLRPSDLTRLTLLPAPAQVQPSDHVHIPRCQLHPHTPLPWEALAVFSLNAVRGEAWRAEADQEDSGVAAEWLVAWAWDQTMCNWRRVGGCLTFHGQSSAGLVKEIDGEIWNLGAWL